MPNDSFFFPDGGTGAGPSLCELTELHSRGSTGVWDSSPGKAPGGMGGLWLCQTRRLSCLDQRLSHEPVQASLLVLEPSCGAAGSFADPGEKEAVEILPSGARRFLATGTNCSSSEATSVSE